MYARNTNFRSHPWLRAVVSRLTLVPGGGFYIHPRGVSRTRVLHVLIATLTGVSVGDLWYAARYKRGRLNRLSGIILE